MRVSLEENGMMEWNDQGCRVASGTPVHENGGLNEDTYLKGANSFPP